MNLVGQFNFLWFNLFLLYVKESFSAFDFILIFEHRNSPLAIISGMKSIKTSKGQAFLFVLILLNMEMGKTLNGEKN